MEENELRILNECRIDVQQFEFEPHLKLYAPDKITEDNIYQFMIGHEEFYYLTHGMVPHDDEEGNIIDFPEIQPTANIFTDDRLLSKAFLLTGQTGCGRHTVNDAFIAEMMDIIREKLDDGMNINDVFRYYKINLANIYSVDKPQRMKVLEDMFAELTALADSEWSQELIIAVCFDGVTEILNNKKTAVYFVKQISNLLNQSQMMFYFTCIFEGNASEIKDKYKKPFIVYEMSEPDETMRVLYFNKLILKYKNIAPDYKETELAQLTDGFTFAMLERLKQMYLMYAKAIILHAGWELQDYIVSNEVPPEELIIIKKSVLDNFIEILKKSRYVENLKVPFINAGYQNMAMPVNTVNADDNTNADVSDSQQQKQNDKSKISENEAEDVIANLHSFEAMDEFAMNLPAAV